MFLCIKLRKIRINIQYNAIYIHYCLPLQTDGGFFQKISIKWKKNRETPPSVCKTHSLFACRIEGQHAKEGKHDHEKSDCSGIFDRMRKRWKNGISEHTGGAFFRKKAGSACKRAYARPLGGGCEECCGRCVCDRLRRVRNAPRRDPLPPPFGERRGGGPFRPLTCSVLQPGRL